MQTTRIWRRAALVLVLVAGCSDNGDQVGSAASSGVSDPDEDARQAPVTTTSTARSAPPGGMRVATAPALASLQNLLAAETFIEELVVPVRSCPLGDPNTPFDRIAAALGDDDVSRVVRDGRLDSLLFSLGPDITLASCTIALDLATSDIAFVRLEARPAAQPIEPFMNLTHDPATVKLTMGVAHRGGHFYQYCGDLPDSAWTSCTVGWRDDAIDIAITFSGAEAKLVDLETTARILADLLDAITTDLAACSLTADPAKPAVRFLASGHATIVADTSKPREGREPP